MKSPTSILGMKHTKAITARQHHRREYIVFRMFASTSLMAVLSLFFLLFIEKLSIMITRMARLKKRISLMVGFHSNNPVYLNLNLYLWQILSLL